MLLGWSVGGQGGVVGVAHVWERMWVPPRSGRGGSDDQRLFLWTWVRASKLGDAWWCWWFWRVGNEGVANDEGFGKEVVQKEIFNIQFFWHFIYLTSVYKFHRNVMSSFTSLCKFHMKVMALFTYGFYIWKDYIRKKIRM